MGETMDEYPDAPHPNEPELPDGWTATYEPIDF